MMKIETGTHLVGRYDEVLPASVCDLVVNYLNREKPAPERTNGSLPWHNSDNIGFSKVLDTSLRATLDRYRFLFNQLVCYQYNVIAYPHFSDLVIWREGMSMDFHKDDGYEGLKENVFRVRKYSMVVYLNDNYAGGETVIQLANSEPYVSRPKKGSLVIFKSNDECIHGVNKVIEGTRYTMANWFATDISSCEVVDQYK